MSTDGGSSGEAVRCLSGRMEMEAVSKMKAMTPAPPQMKAMDRATDGERRESARVSCLGTSLCV